MLILEAGDSHKPKLLLVHGLGALAMQDWFGIINKLTQQYHVMAIDLPGFGHSDYPKGRYSPENYAATLASLIKQTDNKPITVVGHSMGGAVSLYLAGKYPQYVKKLVLVDAAGILQKTAFIKPITHIPKPSSFLPTFLQTAFLKNKLAQLNDFTAGIVEETSINSYITEVLHQSDGAWRLLMGEKPNMNAALSLVEQNFSTVVQNVTMPSGIIWGKNDAIAPLRTGQVLNHVLVNSELIVLANSGHVPMKDNTEKFMDSLFSVLNNTAIQDKSAQPFSQLINETLYCEDKHTRYFSGHYDRVVIKNCSNVTIEDLSAHSIVITDSLVKMSNVVIKSNDVALHVENAVVQITNSTVTAKYGVDVINSRFDAAGMKINASQYGLKAQGENNIIFSLSELHSPIYSGVVHGAFEPGTGLFDTVMLSH